MAFRCDPYHPPAWIDRTEGQPKLTLIPKCRVKVLRLIVCIAIACV